MENSARIRINLSTRELEIEGSEQFVKEYADKIENLLNSLGNPANSKLPANSPVAEVKGASVVIPLSNSGISVAFGEYLHSFPSEITDSERMLIAGFYVQSQSPDNSFITSAANDLLKEQGIKIGNPAEGVAKNKKAKKVFAVTKGTFRVSQTGIAHINSLLEKNNS